MARSVEEITFELEVALQERERILKEIERLKDQIADHGRAIVGLKALLRVFDIYLEK